MLRRKTGDYVKEGEEIATLYTNRQDALASAERTLLAATEITKEKPADEPLVYCTVE